MNIQDMVKDALIQVESLTGVKPELLFSCFRKRDNKFFFEVHMNHLNQVLILETEVTLDEIPLQERQSLE